MPPNSASSKCSQTHRHRSRRRTDTALAAPDPRARHNPARNRRRRSPEAHWRTPRPVRCVPGVRARPAARRAFAVGPPRPDDGVAVDDDGDQQIESSHPVALGFAGAVADFAQAADAQGVLQGMMGFTLVFDDVDGCGRADPGVGAGLLYWAMPSPSTGRAELTKGPALQSRTIENLAE